jgi:hypothetical protein
MKIKHTRHDKKFDVGEISREISELLQQGFLGPYADDAVLHSICVCVAQYINPYKDTGMIDWYNIDAVINYMGVLHVTVEYRMSPTSTVKSFTVRYSYNEDN